MVKELSHINVKGEVSMVDVSQKPKSLRQAKAQAVIECEKNTLRAVLAGAVKKGNVVTTAKLAGVMAAKKTADLIPLCHPLALNHIDIDFLLPDLPEQQLTEKSEQSSAKLEITITSIVSTHAPTGVEMEALTAVSVAALTFYDMVKALDKSITIKNIQLLEKSGGQSGNFKR